MTKDTLISQIIATITDNGNQDITGTKLQEILVSIVETLYSKIDEAVIGANPGDFSEIILQQLGYRTDATVSQKVITESLNALTSGANPIPKFARVERLVGFRPIQGSSLLDGQIVYVDSDYPSDDNFYWAALDGNYYSWFTNAQLYKTSPDMPMLNKLFECEEDGKQYIIVTEPNELFSKSIKLVVLGEELGSGGDSPDMSDYATKTYVDDKVSNIEIQTGAFKLAQQKAKNNNGIWAWMLEEGEIKKPIWHIGDGNFIDAVGALIHFETEPELNVFQYTIVLDEDNATTYVPIERNRIYSMVVDWGDGSEPQSFNQAGSVMGLSHTYTGAAGAKYQITLKGTIPNLVFGRTGRWNPLQLYSIDNNTLQTATDFAEETRQNSFEGCENLVSVSSNALSNSTNKTSMRFANCKSLKKLPLGILDGFEFTSLEYFVQGCSMLELSEDFMNALAQKISGVTNLFYAFNGCKGKIHIPDNFFDNVQSGVIDVRQMTQNATGVTGDAKKLYDSLKTKMTTQNVIGCFSGENLSNRDQVPTAWGGTMQ